VPGGGKSLVSRYSAAVQVTRFSRTCGGREINPYKTDSRRVNRLARGQCGAEIGTHHHISGRYLHCYANEMAWREDYRRVPNGDQFQMVVGAAMAHSVSREVL